MYKKILCFDVTFFLPFYYLLNYFLLFYRFLPTTEMLEPILTLIIIKIKGPSGISREAFTTYTFESNEQQTLATSVLPCSPLSSIHLRTTSIPPFSAMDLHISSCGQNIKTQQT